MANLLGLSVPDFEQRYWKSRREFDEAGLTPEEYWNGVAPRPLSAAEIEQVQRIDSASWSHPNAPMPDWARQVRAKDIRIGLLSNMPSPVRDYIVQCPWLPVFDHLTFSCDVRRTKPAPEIYEHSLTGLGVSASDALLLDDRPENIRAAEALGIHGILFTTPGDLVHEVIRRFAVPAPPVATVKEGDAKNDQRN